VLLRAPVVGQARALLWGLVQQQAPESGLGPEYYR